MKSKLEQLKKSKLWTISIVILSGVVAGLTNLQGLHYLAWICLVPIFVIASGEKKYLGFVVGFIAGIVQFYNVPDIVASYSGGHSAMEYIIPYGLKFFMAIKLGIFALIFSYSLSLRSPQRVHLAIIQSLFVASALVLWDFALNLALDGLPLIESPIGAALASCNSAAQWAEFGGVFALSFLVVLVNSLLALSIIRKSRSIATVALGLVVSVYSLGYFRAESFETNSGKEIRVAILNDNSPPDLRWKKENLNKYVGVLLDLSRQGAQIRPDLLVWNEGAVPWAFAPDDDLLLEISKTTRNLGIRHLISYFTSDVCDSTMSYNSVYYLDSSGAVAGRYDKSVLMRGMEKPLIGNVQSGFLTIPFFGGANFKCLENDSPSPILTDLGRVGVMICNESMSDATAATLAGQGAEAFVLMSNDNWIAHSTFAEVHFLSARLRAIEHRKPIIINSNMGHSGIIARSGRILVADKSTCPKVLSGSICLDGSSSNYISYKFSLLFVCLIGVITPVLLTLRKRKKASNP